MLLTLQNVEKKLGGNIILPNVNLQIAGGKIIGLLGPNGSGKTTLLKLISGLARPTGGALYYQDMPYQYPQTSWQINYLPDSLIFPNDYSVAQAIRFYQENFSDFNVQKAYEILQSLQIHLEAQLSQMSKGQQERLTLALVLSRKAQLTLLDEPLAAVDVTTRDEILHMLQNFLDPDSSVIITTHLVFDMQSLFDEVIFLDRGNIQLYQDVPSILASEQQDLLSFYRRYFGENTKGGY